METIQPHAPNRSSDSEVVELWLRRQRSPATRSVYRRDIGRLLRSTSRTLPETGALDLERFAEALAGTGLSPISQGRTLPRSAASSVSPIASGTAGTLRPAWSCRERNRLSQSASFPVKTCGE